MTSKPPNLSKSAGQWYADCVRQFRFRTAGELETLHQAARALTRAEECAKVLKREGLFTDGQKGRIAHPAARLEHQSRAQFLTACRLLGITRPEAGGDGEA
jgi:hypothetical protein